MDKVAINNKSFAKTRNILKDLYVNNSDFFMYKSSSLENINPYDEKNLTNDAINAIVSESSSNIWYFLGEIISVPGKNYNGSWTAYEYELNAANVSLVHCYTNHINTYTVTPRGLSTRPTIYALMIWELLFFNGPDIVINDKYFSGQCDFKYLLQMVDLLPPCLKNKLIYNDSSIANIDSKRKCSIASKAISNVNLEELRKENSNKISLYGNFEILPINVEMLDIDFDNGVNIIETPIGERTSPSGERAHRFVRDAFKWRPEYLDLSIPALLGLISDYSLNTYVYIQFDYVQLGRNDEWANHVIEAEHMTAAEASKKIYLNRFHPRTHNG